MNEELSEQELLEQEEIKNPLDGLKTVFTNFEWGISLSVGGYLFLIFLGLSYNFIYFSAFKINIFLFSEINDFLMAPLANPLLIILGLISIGIAFLVLHFGFLWKKKHYKSYEITMLIMMLGKKVDQKKMNKINQSPLSIAFLVILYLFMAAIYYGMYRSYKTLHNKNIYHYKLSIDKSLLKNLDSLIYVGDNSAHYFLFDTISREATVIPKDQVKFVRIVKNPKGRIM